VHLPQSGKDVGAFGEIERSDHAAAFQPLIDAELIADVLALHDQEFRIELLFQLSLPLEGEIGRADDQYAFGKATKFQFANGEARHDRLARAGVVGQQETHPREFEQIVVETASS
jgi:hypothetical protein